MRFPTAVVIAGVASLLHKLHEELDCGPLREEKMRNAVESMHLSFSLC